jgi:hypothetical protein
MIDLESGLNYMLRQEMAKFNEIKGEDLYFLKEWLKVLAKVCSILIKYFIPSIERPFEKKIKIFGF